MSDKLLHGPAGTLYGRLALSTEGTSGFEGFGVNDAWDEYSQNCEASPDFKDTFVEAYRRAFLDSVIEKTVEIEGRTEVPHVDFGFRAGRLYAMMAFDESEYPLAGFRTVNDAFEDYLERLGLTEEEAETAERPPPGQAYDSGFHKGFREEWKEKLREELRMGSPVERNSKD